MDIHKHLQEKEKQRKYEETRWKINIISETRVRELIFAPITPSILIPPLVIEKPLIEQAREEFLKKLNYQEVQ